jgi:hypothetical protein
MIWPFRPVVEAFWPRAFRQHKYALPQAPVAKAAGNDKKRHEGQVNSQKAHDVPSLHKDNIQRLICTRLPMLSNDNKRSASPEKGLPG